MSVTADDHPTVKPVVDYWGKNHKAGRRVLLIKLDPKPKFEGSLHDVFTSGGTVMGTSIRYLKGE